MRFGAHRRRCFKAFGNLPLGIATQECRMEAVLKHMTTPMMDQLASSFETPAITVCAPGVSSHSAVQPVSQCDAEIFAADTDPKETFLHETLAAALQTYGVQRYAVSRLLHCQYIEKKDRHRHLTHVRPTLCHLFRNMHPNVGSPILSVDIPSFRFSFFYFTNENRKRLT